MFDLVNFTEFKLIIRERFLGLSVKVILGCVTTQGRQIL